MSNPIRVLHVFGKLDAGGAESRTMDIYRSINRSKVQFDFAIHTEDECFFSEEVRSLGGRIFCFPRFSGNYFSYKKAWSSFFKEYSEYRIIHGHQTSTGFIYLNEAKKNDVFKRIAHARNSNKDSLLKKYTTKLVRIYATHLFAVSKLAGISEFGEKLVHNGTVKIIPNAIDVSLYKFNIDKRNKIRRELGLKDELAVVHIGRFHSQKNHHFLLEVFKVFLESNKHAMLFLVGDGPLRNEIKSKIKDLKMEENVRMMGVRLDVPDLLQAMDVLLFPSHYEGLPGVVLEAQASGLSCVISDTITDEVKITDLVEYVSLDKNTKYWSDKIKRFSQGIERRNTYREIVDAGFDIESVSSWYEDYYIE